MECASTLWGHQFIEDSDALKNQGDHMSGKPGYVREFDSYQGSVRELWTEVGETA